MKAKLLVGSLALAVTVGSSNINLAQTPAAAGAKAGAQAAPVTVEDLQKKIAELEAEQDALKSRMESGGGSVDGVAAAAAGGAKKKSAWSSVGLEFYGFLKLDAAWDQSRVDSGNFARWVKSEEGYEDDNQFSLTARQTRLGFLLHGPELGSVKTGGKVEIDFYGGGAENKAAIQMRKAYMTVNWTAIDLEVRAGQDADLISPLVPETVNYTVQWWAGNIGYRRPQVRVTKGFNIGGDVNLDLAVAAVRTIGHAAPTFVTNDPGYESGKDAGFPTTQVRAGLSFPLLGETPTSVGVSGHWGQEEYDLDNFDSHERLDTWSINLDVALPITKWLRLKGEGFFGSDLDTYLGGIGQGITVVPATSVKRVGSYGGWVAASLGPFEKWRFNIGMSADNPNDGDLAVGARSLNLTYYGNVFFHFYENMELALELAWWSTNYKDSPNGDSLRLQTALIFKF